MITLKHNIFDMKKRNFKVLGLKKHKISNLHLLGNYGGGDGDGETVTIGSDTLPYLPTVINCPETTTCSYSYNPTDCKTTRTLGDNTFNQSCDCGGLVTAADC